LAFLLCFVTRIQHRKAMPSSLSDALEQLHRPLALRAMPDGVVAVRFLDETPDHSVPPGHAYVPPIHPEDLGDPGFRRDHSLRMAYVAGSMAHGIASEEIVESAARAGCLGFYGAAGQAPERVEQAITRLKASLGDLPFGFNLLYSPQESSLETAHADLYLRHQVRLVEASAYLDVSLPLVRYRLSGLRVGPDGLPVPANKVVAKVSRIEVARKFLSPAPARLVGELLARGEITEQQAQAAARLPLADDVTAEADSGGHTDNRPALNLLPTIIALRDRMARENAALGWHHPTRVGLGGGIATPHSVAAAFSMGAAYVLVGTVHQACVESGTSDLARAMLAAAEQADTAMAAAADMFEMGVKVQVLKRGTLFAMRAQKLYDLYRAYPSFEAAPAADQAVVEKQMLRRPFEAVWADCVTYFQRRDPSQITRAQSDPRHKMALVFRWYLATASRWATQGVPDRQADYQVWCGPSMGAFNEWAKGSFLELPANRHLAAVAHSLMRGAALLKRAEIARLQGIHSAEVNPRPVQVSHAAARIPA
jgi:PfaD family protein